MIPHRMNYVRSKFSIKTLSYKLGYEHWENVDNRARGTRCEIDALETYQGNQTPADRDIKLHFPSYVVEV